MKEGFLFDGVGTDGGNIAILKGVKLPTNINVISKGNTKAVNINNGKVILDLFFPICLPLVQVNRIIC